MTPSPWHSWIPFPTQAGRSGCGPFIDANGNIMTRSSQRQFSSLYAWSSIGTSSYNAVQFTARKAPTSASPSTSATLLSHDRHGSETERSSEFTTNSFGHYQRFNPKLNLWPPRITTYVSAHRQFHLQLPFGRGMSYAAESIRASTPSSAVDLSASPAGPAACPSPSSLRSAYATNYQRQTPAVSRWPLKIRKHFVARGLPQVFDNPMR